jgi:hypothetical protein
VAWYRFGSPFRFSDIDREMPLRFSFLSVRESKMTTKAVAWDTGGKLGIAT